MTTKEDAFLKRCKELEAKAARDLAKIRGEPLGVEAVVDEMPPDLAGTLCEIVKASGMSGREIARRSGGLFSHTVVYELLNGRKITFECAQRIAIIVGWRLTLVKDARISMREAEVQHDNNADVAASTENATFQAIAPPTGQFDDGVPERKAPPLDRSRFGSNYNNNIARRCDREAR